MYTGFDVEMANRLAKDLTVRLELVPVTLESMTHALDQASCDIGMSGTPVTPMRASVMLFSEPYLDETLGVDRQGPPA